MEEEEFEPRTTRKSRGKIFEQKVTKDWGQGPFSERSGAGSGNAGTERLFHSLLPHRTRRKRIPARVGGASRWPSAGSFRFLLSDLYGGRIEKVMSGRPSFALRAIDSKPPHGFSPCGHVANSSCPNHRQAFGGFVQILHIQIFFTGGNEGLGAGTFFRKVRRRERECGD
jgi:hypothetical protein